MKTNKNMTFTMHNSGISTEVETHMQQETALVLESLAQLYVLSDGRLSLITTEIPCDDDALKIRIEIGRKSVSMAHDTKLERIRECVASMRAEIDEFIRKGGKPIEAERPFMALFATLEKELA